MDIILASASPRRRELMKLITDDFTAVSTDCDETLPPDIPAVSASQYLAVLKAKAAGQEYPGSLIIGCDTTVIVDDTILGKPADKNECRRFMQMLSGRTHQVITGCCLLYKEMIRSFSVVTDVTFRPLSDEEIEKYISTDEPYDKAGGYGIQGKGALLASGINGDFFNVVGLPVSALDQELNKFINDIKEN